MIFAVIYVLLNSDKTAKSFFSINICCFPTMFTFYCTTWHGLAQFSSKLCMCSISTPHKIRTFTVRLAGNGHYQGNGFAVLALAMPVDHPNVAATILRISFPGDQKAILNLLKNIIFGQVTVVRFQICWCVQSFIKMVHAFCLQTPIPAKCSMCAC